MRMHNAATGETVEVVSETPELLVLRATWTRPGRRTLPHRHPGMQERWTVVEGRAAVDVEGVVAELTAGQSAVAEPGQRHVAWNTSDEQAVVTIEMRPALRWVEFVRRLFAGEPAAALLVEFRDEVQVG